MQQLSYTRLYADSGGESHFEDIDVTLESVDFAPPAPPVNVADLFPASRCKLLTAPAGWGGDVPHPSPLRQLFAVLSGAMEVTASDGETRLFRTGDLLLLEDTSGRGHTTTIPEDLRLLSVTLEE
jgi:EutQ-like cupin domain